MTHAFSPSFDSVAVIGLLVAIWLPVSAVAQTDGPPMAAVVRSVAPEYPLQARQRRLQGSGILEAKVDFKTGHVTSVQMIKSTGHKILDDAALTAFRQWRFKPGTVRQFRTPIQYEMARSRADAMEKIRRLRATETQRR